MVYNISIGLCVNTSSDPNGFLYVKPNCYVIIMKRG